MAINRNAVIIHTWRQQGIGTCDIEAVYNATVIIKYGIGKFRLTNKTVYDNGDLPSQCLFFNLARSEFSPL